MLLSLSLSVPLNDVRPPLSSLSSSLFRFSLFPSLFRSVNILISSLLPLLLSLSPSLSCCSSLSLRSSALKLSSPLAPLLLCSIVCLLSSLSRLCLPLVTPVYSSSLISPSSGCWFLSLSLSPHQTPPSYQPLCSHVLPPLVFSVHLSLSSHLSSLISWLSAVSLSLLAPSLSIGSLVSPLSSPRCPATGLVRQFVSPTVSFLPPLILSLLAITFFSLILVLSFLVFSLSLSLLLSLALFLSLSPIISLLPFSHLSFLDPLLDLLLSSLFVSLYSGTNPPPLNGPYFSSLPPSRFCISLPLSSSGLLVPCLPSTYGCYSSLSSLSRRRLLILALSPHLSSLLFSSPSFSSLSHYLSLSSQPSPLLPLFCVVLSLPVLIPSTLSHPPRQQSPSLSQSFFVSQIFCSLCSRVCSLLLSLLSSSILLLSSSSLPYWVYSFYLSEARLPHPLPFSLLPLSPTLPRCLSLRSISPVPPAPSLLPPLFLFSLYLS
ncbi:hypothetical protein C7M84_004171 [Penaeus vannamei]|uniref:Uncharacterized protein n=1 Tax=Penaeus vannamei TaxID=6689 RepID=A0A3R7MA86_PENVA|nr:hypothetical protein C7M84_004171 [Penaeus vannamei]